MSAYVFRHGGREEWMILAPPCAQALTDIIAVVRVWTKVICVGKGSLSPSDRSGSLSAQRGQPEGCVGRPTFQSVDLLLQLLHGPLGELGAGLSLRVAADGEHPGGVSSPT